MCFYFCWLAPLERVFFVIVLHRMDAVVERIHASPLRCCIGAAGAGASALTMLMSVPGCSRTLVDAEIPYGASASAELLDNFPKRHLAASVATELAQNKYHRTETLLDEEGVDTKVLQLVGIGCTAAIITDRDRKGEDAAFVSAWHAGGVVTYRILFKRQGATRCEQEAVVGRLIVFALARTANVLQGATPASLGLPPIVPASADTSTDEMGTVYYVEHSPAPDPYLLLLRGQVNRIVFNKHGIPRHSILPHTDENNDIEHATYLLVPGSFSPLHWGHTELARVAANVVRRSARHVVKCGLSAKSCKRPVIVTYEISATIVGKRALHEHDLRSRVSQFTEAGIRVAITTAKLFVDKAKMFPNHGMVLGIDTAERLLDPRHYGGSPGKVIDALKDIDAQGCYFVVGGRIRSNGDNTEGHWEDLTSGGLKDRIPVGFDHMFIPITKEDFRVDVSSTEIRARRGDVKEMKLYVDVERIYNELRELGVGPSDPVTVEQLLPFDQYHYFGTDTVDEGAKQAKISGNAAKVLDVGSGLGGPARYLAKQHGCLVTAVELQRDVSDVAKDLTQRSGMAAAVTHRCGDFLAPDEEVLALDRGQFDAAVSWLVFVHITDRATLLRRCFDALKPGGRLFVEDFHAIGTLTREEWAHLRADVHCEFLPSLTEFKSQCEAAGFVNVDMQDYTVEARIFARERYNAYSKTFDRHVRVHGHETASGMRHFYEVIANLFDAGHFGLCRVLAFKPE